MVTPYEAPWVWPHFSKAEMKCRCGCNQMRMQDGFMSRLEHLRYRLNRPMRVTSGYRCPTYNDAISGSGKTGPHTTGQAADIAISGADVVLLFRYALQVGMTGFGLKQHGPFQQRFIHLDDLSGDAWPRPRIWSYA